MSHIQKVHDEICRAMCVLDEPARAKEHLRIALDNLRRKRRKRAPSQSRPMTWRIGDEARRMHREDPEMMLQDIAEKLHVNNGRIHEAIYDGKWRRPDDKDK